MRFDKFTLKSQEMIQNAQHLAERFGHQQIEPEHLARALLEQKEGVIPPILGKIGANQNQLIKELESILERMPSVSGSGTGQVYLSPRAKTVLDRAFAETNRSGTAVETAAGSSRLQRSRLMAGIDNQPIQRHDRPQRHEALCFC